MLRVILHTIPVFILSYTAQILMKRGVNSVGVITWANLVAHPMDVLMTLVFNWSVIAGFVLAGLGAILYLIVLSQYELTIVFPILGALAFVLLPIVSLVFLHESVNPGRIAGTVIIAIGIIIVARN